MRFVLIRAIIFKEGDKCSRIAPSTTACIVHNMKEWWTVRHLYQLRWLAAVKSPQEESTSGLRKRHFGHIMDVGHPHRQLIQQLNPKASHQAHPVNWNIKYTHHAMDYSCTSIYRVDIDSHTSPIHSNWFIDMVLNKMKYIHQVYSTSALRQLV